MGFFADKVIPAMIFIFMGFILIRAFKNPLSDFMNWIRGLIGNARDRASSGEQAGGMTVAYE